MVAKGTLGLPFIKCVQHGVCVTVCCAPGVSINTPTQTHRNTHTDNSVHDGYGRMLHHLPQRITDSCVPVALGKFQIIPAAKPRNLFVSASSCLEQFSSDLLEAVVSIKLGLNERVGDEVERGN